ncbi:tetratricopeptide repeat protein [Marinicella sp. W31]|uniref:tetratricopeptide repeat protein n=1 Tax=Marinicella sp. W31 TaxID=3023713 RepID=UPI0037569396
MKSYKSYCFIYALLTVHLLFSYFPASSQEIETLCDNGFMVEEGFIVEIKKVQIDCQKLLSDLVNQGKQQEAIEKSFNLIRQLLHQGHYATAEAFLTQIDVLIPLTENPEWEYQWLRLKGQQSYYQRKYHRSVRQFHKAQKIAIKENNELWLAKSYNDISNAYQELGDLVGAIESLQKSLELKEKIGDKFSIAVTLNNLGNLYRKLKDPASALRFYQRTASLYESISDIDLTSDYAHLYENIGLAYADMGKMDAGLQALDNSIVLYQELKEFSDLVRVYLSQSHLLNLQEKYNEASEVLNKVELLEQEHYLEPKLLLRLYKAKSNLGLNEFAAAIRYGKESLEMAEESGDIINQSEALYILSEIQEKLGDKEAALLYLQQYLIVNNQVNQQIVDEQLVNLESELRYQDSEKQLQLLNKDYEIQELKVSQQRLWLTLLISGFLILAFIFRHVYQRKKRENQLLMADIVEYEKKYESMGQSQLQLEEIFSAISEPIVCFDVAGYVLFINQPFADLFGASLLEFKNCKIDDCCPQLIDYFQMVVIEDESFETPSLDQVTLNINDQEILCHLSIYLLTSSNDYVVMHINQDQQPPVGLDSTLRNLNHFQELSENLKNISDALSCADVDDSESLLKQIAVIEQRLSKSLYPSQEENKKKSFREELVNLMCLTVFTWEISTETDKISLAEKSKVWRVSIDNGSLRTRSMDRYMNINSLPQKPRWRYVVRTAYYVLANCQLDDVRRKELTQQLTKFSELERCLV